MLSHHQQRKILQARPNFTTRKLNSSQIFCCILKFYRKFYSFLLLLPIFPISLYKPLDFFFLYITFFIFRDNKICLIIAIGQEEILWRFYMIFHCTQFPTFLLTTSLTFFPSSNLGGFQLLDLSIDTNTTNCGFGRI